MFPTPTLPPPPPCNPGPTRVCKHVNDQCVGGAVAEAPHAVHAVHLQRVQAAGSERREWGPSGGDGRNQACISLFLP